MKTKGHEQSLEVRALSRAYANGELTPEALVEELYARIGRNGQPNVWIHLAPKQLVLERARALSARGPGPELPLFGVPFGVKDNIDVAGMPTTAGCPDFAYVASQSAPCVQALEQAGALCLGKTNLDQFATGLVGTRSPYGACRNVFRPEYLSGGSSSGSAVAVAAGHVSLALGTDTAGSGRVPAALNNIVGLKPTRGLLSTVGVVPACRSLDCVSVFALCVDDAALARAVISRENTTTAASGALAPGMRVGVPRALEWFGDAESEALFAAAVARLEALGARPVPIDFAPFRALGDLLYGPWVVERYLSVGEFLERSPGAALPVTREIIMGAKQVASTDVFRGLYRLQELKAACLESLRSVEVLATPTVPTHYRIDEDAREPRLVNDRLGIYTRFANFLGVPVLAVPAGFRGDGLPFGVSLVGQPGCDAALDGLGAALHARSGAGMGSTRAPAPARELEAHGPPQEARIAVAGAHMRGLALHPELLACGARFVRTTRTEASYRLYVLPGSKPLKPGLVRASGAGHAIEIELFDISWAGLGTLMSRVAPPLAIGNVRTEYGEWVKGFLCEPYALEGAEEISSRGGFRAYLDGRG